MEEVKMEEVKDVSEKMQKLKETNNIEFIKISAYIEGYLAAQKQKEIKNN